jgi:hypothetical protein
MILRLDGAKKRSVYQGPGLGVWYALEYPTGRTLAWWEGEEGEREEIGDFPTLEEAYEAIEAHFSRKDGRDHGQPGPGRGPGAPFRLRVPRGRGGRG